MPRLTHVKVPVEEFEMLRELAETPELRRYFKTAASGCVLTWLEQIGNDPRDTTSGHANTTDGVNTVGAPVASTPGESEA